MSHKYMNSECVCGFKPPNECNPDCERCMLIKRIAELDVDVIALKKLFMEQISRVDRLRGALLQIKTKCLPGEYAYLVASDALAETTDPDPKPSKFSDPNACPECGSDDWIKVLPSICACCGCGKVE